MLEIGDGYRAKNSEMGSSGLPFARAGNVNNGFHFDDADLLKDESVKLAGEKLSRPGDITFTSKGTFGRFAFVRQDTPPFVYSPQLCYWRVKREGLIERRFLYYWMQGIDCKNQLNEVKGLTDMADYVSLTNQRKMWFSAPPLPIQRRIAGILSAYDDLIENNQRRIKILEKMARSLYREWFVHFRFPGHDKVKMVPSPLGPIPQGWEVVPFTEIADVLSGGTPKTDVSDYWNGDIPFFTPRDAPSCFYVQDTDKHVTERGLSNCASELYAPETVFITARGTVGKVALPSIPMAMNQSCYALRGRAGMPQRFLFLMTLQQVDYLKKNTGGATFDTIVIDTFRRMQVIKPGRDLIALFVGHTDAMFEAVNTLQRQTANPAAPETCFSSGCCCGRFR